MEPAAAACGRRGAHALALQPGERVMKSWSLACTAACAAWCHATWCGAGHAHAEGLQIYGTLDAAVGHFTGIRAHAGGGQPGRPPSRATTTVNAMGPGGATGATLGLRGDEHLGGDTYLRFVAETGFCGVGLSQPDSGGDPWCGGGGFLQRQAWIGLDSPRIGAWRAGRQLTLLARHSAEADAFGNSYTGQVGNLSLIGNNLGGLGMKRLDQSVDWNAPTGTQGLELQAQYSAHAGMRAPYIDRDQPPDVGALLAGVAWRRGGWLLGIDWSRWQHAFGSHPDRPDRSYRLLMAYAVAPLGEGSLYGQLQQGTADGGTGRQRLFSVGLSWPAADPGGSWMLSAARHVDALSPTSVPLRASAATQYAIGYRHALSPATMVYASAAHIANDSAEAGRRGTDFAVGAAGELFHGVAGRPSTGIAVGLSHSF